MSDQADRLRQLVRTGSHVAVAGPRQHAAHRALDATARTRTLVFTSGKGGVGTSNLALNFALALGDLGLSVLLVDADWGRANLDLLCGLAPRCDLGDVLAGDCSLDEILLPARPGSAVQLLPGAHAVRSSAALLDEAPEHLASHLAELSSETDYLLIDAGGGLAPAIASLAAEADEIVVVTTPEPTAMADAHAAIARLRPLVSGSAPRPQLRALVNQARSASEGADCLARICASCRQFQGLAVTPLGLVPRDPRVARAVRDRRPFLAERFPGPAARAVRRVTRSLLAEHRPRQASRGCLAPSRLRDGIVAGLRSFQGF